jgi:hypothetical protein
MLHLEEVLEHAVIAEYTTYTNNNELKMQARSESVKYKRGAGE